MKIKDLLSNSLSAKLARYLFNYGDSLFGYPDFIYGQVKYFTTENGNYFKGLVFIGFKTENKSDKRLWLTSKSPTYKLAYEEMYEAVSVAAKRFNFTIWVENETGETIYIRKNYLTETNI